MGFCGFLPFRGEETPGAVQHCWDGGQSRRAHPHLLFQAEIVKRLSAICAQIVPFLTQEVSWGCAGKGQSGAMLSRGGNRGERTRLEGWERFGALLIALLSAPAAGPAGSGAGQAGHHGRAQQHRGGESHCVQWGGRRGVFIA